MGEITKGILGGFSGLVGTVVGANFRGKDIMRSKPKKSSKKPVQGQLDQRSKFAAVTSFLSHFAEVISLGFKAKTKFQSPMNSAVKQNLLNAIDGSSPVFSLDYSMVQLTNGKLPGISLLTFTAQEGNKATLTWDITEATRYDPEQQLIRDKDTLRLVLYDERNAGSYTTGYTTTRSSGTFKASLPMADEGDTIHAWVSFVSADKKTVSTSQYIGSIIVIS